MHELEELLAAVKALRDEVRGPRDCPKARKLYQDRVFKAYEEFTCPRPSPEPSNAK